LVEQCCRRALEQRSQWAAEMGELAPHTAQLSGEELDRLLDPAHFLGQARAWVWGARRPPHSQRLAPPPPRQQINLFSSQPASQ
ncbi:hypothetical protein ACPTFH_31135, partial [Pseudomonas aeruginosa]